MGGVAEAGGRTQTHSLFKHAFSYYPNPVGWLDEQPVVVERLPRDGMDLIHGLEFRP